LKLSKFNLHICRWVFSGYSGFLH